MKINGIGILPGHRISYIDHLVPLCQILGVPLVVTDPFIQELIERYYPPMKIVLSEPEDYCLDEVLRGYELFIYVDFYRKGHGGFQFAEYGTTLKARSLFGFHGNLDKCLDIYWLERLCDEDIVLIYGQQMLQWMRVKGIDDRVEKKVLCGNYRAKFYESNRQFFDRKVKFLKQEQSEKKTVLYAPTWTSINRKSELRFEYSSFENVYPFIFDRVPEDFHLIVKLHPHHKFLDPNGIEDLQSRYPHIQFLDNFPLIYPLMKQVDIYLGDYSSVGYDLLYFKRPMYFLTDSKTSFLRQGGRVIQKSEYPNLYDLLKKEELRLEKQEQIYQTAFSQTVDLQEQVCKFLQ